MLLNVSLEAFSKAVADSYSTINKKMQIMII